jgi:hypothetical protein
MHTYSLPTCTTTRATTTCAAVVCVSRGSHWMLPIFLYIVWVKRVQKRTGGHGKRARGGVKWIAVPSHGTLMSIAEFSTITIGFVAPPPISFSLVLFVPQCSIRSLFACAALCKRNITLLRCSLTDSSTTATRLLPVLCEYSSTQISVPIPFHISIPHLPDTCIRCVCRAFHGQLPGSM